MLVDAYEVVPNNKIKFEYEFQCDCDGTIINKIVRYQITEQKISNFDTYNLAFGPYNEKREIIDNVKTNNTDLIKTLSTVAKTSITFTDTIGDVLIWAEGSNAARTRLYQIHISKFYDEIHENFSIWGVTETELELFKKERDYHYSAFIARRKFTKN